MSGRKKIEDGLFVTGWCLIGVAIIFFSIVQLTGFQIDKMLFPCILHEVTGYYCPGCGGTRAVKALLQGHPVQSFLYHPFVLYATAVGGWFLISQTVERASKGKIKMGMHYHDGYLWFSLVIIAINFIVKNLILIIMGTDILAQIV